MPSAPLHPVGRVGDQLSRSKSKPASLTDTYVTSQPYAARRSSGVDALGHPAHGQAEQLVDRAHPLGVAAGQVVVDGQHVHRAAQRAWPAAADGCGQRLALTGGHLDDVAGEHRQRADELHVVGPLPERAAAASRPRAQISARESGRFRVMAVFLGAAVFFGAVVAVADSVARHSTARAVNSASDSFWSAFSLVSAKGRAARIGARSTVAPGRSRNRARQDMNQAEKRIAVDVTGAVSRRSIRSALRVLPRSPSGRNFGEPDGRSFGEPDGRNFGEVVAIRVA